MKNQYHSVKYILFTFLILIFGCERSIDELEPATYPTNPNVFINTFSSGLNYAAFGGSVPTAFQVDENETIEGSEASMRFEVPDVNDPRGAYAGGSFFTEVGRDLSGYDALTFWIRATKAAEIDILGFGNDLGESKYQASISALPVNTNWQKVIIPIPDPSKLTAERGLLFYSEGPEDGRGYTFWLDEVKFEKLGTLAHPKASIMEGQEVTVSAEIGETVQVTGITSTFNLPSGIDRTVNAAPGYCEYTSSDENVAVVNEIGQIMVQGAGTSVIKATLGSVEASGSLTVNSTGITEGPAAPAPIPDQSPENVISLFSNAYDNVPVDTWNTRWEFSTAEEFFTTVQGDDVIRYRNLNFVGIEFSSETVDASEMTHFHIDIWTPDNTDPPNNFKILLADFGEDGQFGGGDDSSHEITIGRPTLQSEQWVSIDVPLSSFSGLQNRGHLAQLVLSGDLPNVYIDNVYFYDDGSNGGGGETSPGSAAPMPSHPASDVISIFSDAYTNIPGTNLNPDWGQATVVTEVNIDGNNTLRYGGLNYQGTELQGNTDVSEMNYLHIDYWTSNSSLLSIFLISPGPIETPYSLAVPTSGWNSVDIPLSEFSPVELNEIFQFKFEGDGDIYLDNIYFRK